MVAYLTDARLTTVTSREGYVSWGDYNLLFTPAYDCIYECIRDWIREWDIALNMSEVWPNRRYEIITMLSDGTVGQFCEPSQGKAKGRKWKHSIGAKRRYSRVITFSRIFGSLTWPSSGFWRSGRLLSDGNQKYRLCLVQSWYSLEKRPHGRLSNRCLADNSDKERRLCQLGGL